MTFEDFGNIFSLFCTIVSLLFCLFKYVEHPKRGYLYLVIFCLSHFFSDYYWAIYTLVMQKYPDVSEFVAYLGWNVGYVVLLLLILNMRLEGSERYFHPLMLWPIIPNAIQFILYINFGGILNNLFQVGITTAAMILCMQQILYCWKNRGSGKKLPYLSIIVLLHIIMEYGMWTSSCFSWPSELKNPYMYFSTLTSLITIFFAWAAGMDYENRGDKESLKNEAALRFQMFVQTFISFVIFCGCLGGYFLVLKLKETMPLAEEGMEGTDNIVELLFIISVVLILFVLILIYLITARYNTLMKRQHDIDAGKLSRTSFFITIFITLTLMGFAVVYNTKILYDASVIVVKEDGEDKVKMVATDLENYLAVAQTTLRVVADTIDLMEKNGDSLDEVFRYLEDQTKLQAQQFDENFTGIYAYMDGEYMDGSGWIPPEGYDPVTRDWYNTAVEAGGEIVIVSPYVDAQTGDVVITIAKSITDGEEVKKLGLHNVVCLDVIVNHVQDVTREVSIAGKGYGFIANSDGFIVAHRNQECNGKNVSDIYGQVLIDKIKDIGNGSFSTVIDDEKTTFFVCPIMEQWYAVIAVNDAELMQDVYSQLAVNILISLITFSLITFFYYLGYKNERDYGKKVEELNLQVVSALAASIDAKDAYTNGHSTRVATYSKTIAARYGYSKQRQDEIYMMGLLHDIGKIGVPFEVINKPEGLTNEEYEQMKKHPVIGSEILEKIQERPKLAIGARSHHERYAGGGYPDGLAGDEIPEEARIIAVADAYDAMSSRRSYRGVMTQEQVRAEIERGSGTQFDPKFAKIMLQMIDEDVHYAMRDM